MFLESFAFLKFCLAFLQSALYHCLVDVSKISDNSVTISSILLFCIFVFSSVYDNKLKSKCSILYLSKFPLNSTPFSNFQHSPVEQHNYFRALHKKFSRKRECISEKSLLNSNISKSLTFLNKCALLIA